MRTPPVLRLHGLPPSAGCTLELAYCVEKPTCDGGGVLHAWNGAYSVRWNLDTLFGADDEIAMPGGLWVSGMIAVRDWAIENTQAIEAARD